jgi:hypothetical protein
MNYADSIGAVPPLFTPYVLRREGRLFLVVPGESGKGAVRSFELSPVQVAEMAVGLHVVLHAVGCETRREHAASACTQKPESVCTKPRLPQVWSGQHV